MDMTLTSLLSASRDVVEVPVLDERSFHLGRYCNGSVLKFRGLVRDVLDPEFVQLEGKAPSLNDTSDLVERVPLVVTLFPHVSDWAKRAYFKTPCVGNNSHCTEPGAAPKGIKRAVEQHFDDESCPPIQNQKKAKIVEKQGLESDETSLQGSQAVNIYVYDGHSKDTPLDAFKVNEAFEFVGILDLGVPGESDQKEDAVRQLKELQLSETMDFLPQKRRAGVVLHCCNVNKLESLHHVRPHESQAFYKQIHATNASRLQFCRNEWTKWGQKGDVCAIRQQLVEYLTQTVGGDPLVAEYLLLSLLSHVYARADTSTPLGNCTLNLTLGKALTRDEKDHFIARVEATVRSVMPLVARVDLSLNELNSTNFMPKKDYERDMLVSGVLQVAHGTTILVNETALTAGELHDQGVKNMAALQSLIDKMVLPYDFHYYSMDFPLDVGVLSLSEGKSILPATVALPLIVTREMKDDRHVPEDELIDCFRLYLSVLRSFVVTIGNEQAEMAEKHYVACRKSQRQVAVEDLHRWLRLARLVAISRGEGTISKEAWDTMLQLETQRLGRVAASAVSE